VVIRICISKKNKQHNGQKKKYCSFFNAPLVFFKVYCTRQNLAILSVSKAHTYKCDICHQYAFDGRHHDLVDRYGISNAKKYMNKT
jgi:hypothetical protein